MMRGIAFELRHQSEFPLQVRLHGFPRIVRTLIRPFVGIDGACEIASGFRLHAQPGGLPGSRPSRQHQRSDARQRLNFGSCEAREHAVGRREHDGQCRRNRRRHGGEFAAQGKPGSP
jgi:hypothetical protein